MFELDDDDFTLSPNSNLSSIFSSASNGDSTVSLSYKAPKQPNGNPPKHDTNVELRQQNQSAVIIAKVVSLWKLNDGINIPLGKYMTAIIVTSDSYDLVVYQDKTKMLIREHLENLKLHKNPNEFISFHDNGKQLWNLKFTVQDLNDFQQAITKCGSKIIEEQAVSKKSEVLTRITKVGKSILPEQRLKDTKESSDESSGSPVEIKPMVLPRKFKKINQDKALTPRVMDHSYLPTNHNNMLSSSVVYSQPDYGLSNYLIGQNAELKTSLAEINQKLNNLLSNSDNNNGNNQTTVDCDTLKSRIKCQKLTIDNLTRDLDKSKQTYEVENDKIKLLEDKISNYAQVEIQFQNQLKSKEDELSNEITKNAEIESRLVQMNSLLENTKKETDDVKQQLQEATKNNQPDAERIKKAVKESMNAAYRGIMDEFSEDQKYDVSEIQKVLLDNLKTCSFKLINSLIEENCDRYK